MNPAVTFAAAVISGFAWRAVPVYLVAQVIGAIAGTWLAHAMFAVPILEVSTQVRTGSGQWIAEALAVFGLLGVIWGCLNYSTPVAAGAVATYIAGAYWFTASTSFANPAVTIARSFSDTFSGIRPADAPGFIVAQFAGLLIALPALRALTGHRPSSSN